MLSDTFRQDIIPVRASLLLHEEVDDGEVRGVHHERLVSVGGSRGRIDDDHGGLRGDDGGVVHGKAGGAGGSREDGVVGRTGAGKSTISQGLSRIVEICGGNMLIDGIDINQIDIAQVRSKITVIA